MMKNFVQSSYSLAEELFLLRAPKEVHNKLSPFLNPAICVEKENFLVSIDIEHITNSDLQLFYNSIKEILINCKISKLKTAHYYYDEKKNSIYILGVDYIGILNTDLKEMKWYSTNISIPSRNLFHIYVLDVLSIVLPNVNKIVFHGASLVYKEKSIAILGNSGSGKSTITRILKRDYGLTKNSDDTFVIAVGKDIQLYPINSGEGYESDLIKEFIKDDSDYSVLEDNIFDKKGYIINKNSDLSPFALKYFYILNRNTNQNLQKCTNITIIDAKEIFINLLNCQTNVLTPYLCEKLKLYKTISERIKGSIIDYNFDCDTGILINNIKNNLF